MKIPVYVKILISLFLFVYCHATLKTDTSNVTIKNPQSKVGLGIDNFNKNHLSLVEGKRVGLITNPSGVNSNLRCTSDIFYQNSAINLTALFGPEHGIRGNEYAGGEIKDTIDANTNVPLFSLYGESRKPTKKMLDYVDVLVFDIQDIGIRSYTYIYTMAKAMEASTEYNIPFIVLDRPNPLGGLKIEGNILDTTFSSFVGLYPLPYIHGMTIGELARYFNAEFDINCNLTVIPMENWERNMIFGDTGLDWVPTSPHVPEWQTVFYIASTGIIGELHSVSVGVGYTTPFKLIGTPWINGEVFAESLNQLNLPGVYFRPTYFKPFYSLFKSDVCGVIQLPISDYEAFKPYITGISILYQIISLYPERDLFSNPDRVDMFNKVMGTDLIMNQLINKVPLSIIENSWQQDLNEFYEKRNKYLLY